MRERRRQDSLDGRGVADQEQHLPVRLSPYHCKSFRKEKRRSADRRDEQGVDGNVVDRQGRTAKHECGVHPEPEGKSRRDLGEMRTYQSHRQPPYPTKRSRIRDQTASEAPPMSTTQTI